MDTLWGLLSDNDNAGQEGPVFPQSTSFVRRLYYQTTCLCCPVFVVLDSALECPKTLFDLTSCHFYFSLSLSLSLPRAPSLHKVAESHVDLVNPVDFDVAISSILMSTHNHFDSFILIAIS
ncbi:hypothetical protein AMTRI_Chr07g82350 [Amborella trichopoda]